MSEHFYDPQAIELCKAAPADVDGDRSRAARMLADKLFTVLLGDELPSAGLGYNVSSTSIHINHLMQRHWRGKLETQSLFDCIEAVQKKAVEAWKGRVEQKRLEFRKQDWEAGAPARAARAERIAAREARKENSEAIKTLAVKLGVKRRRAYQIVEDGTADAKQAAVAAEVFKCQPSVFLKPNKRRGRPPDVRTIMAAYMRGYRPGLSWQDFMEFRN